MLVVREVGATPMSPAAIIEKVEKDQPDLKVSSITLPDNEDSSYKMSVNLSGTPTTMYVEVSYCFWAFYYLDVPQRLLKLMKADLQLILL
jgi:hypothetical protein